MILQGREIDEPGPDRGVVFQDFAQLFPWRTALGNVSFGLEMKGVGDSPASWAKGEVFLAERAARSLGASAIWTPANFGPIRRGLPRVVTIHDLYFLDAPGHHFDVAGEARIRDVALQLQQRGQLNRADGVVDEILLLVGQPLGLLFQGLAPGLQLAKRPENKGKQIVAIIPSSSERYLSTWLFADVNTESDSVDDLIKA